MDDFGKTVVASILSFTFGIAAIVHEVQDRSGGGHEGVFGTLLSLLLAGLALLTLLVVCYCVLRGLGEIIDSLQLLVSSHAPALVPTLLSAAAAALTVAAHGALGKSHPVIDVGLSLLAPLATVVGAICVQTGPSKAEATVGYVLVAAPLAVLVWRALESHVDIGTIPAHPGIVALTLVYLSTPLFLFLLTKGARSRRKQLQYAANP